MMLMNKTKQVIEKIVFHQLHQGGGEETRKDMEVMEILSHEHFLPIPTPWPGVSHYYGCELFQNNAELGMCDAVKHN